jgi:hypothetical protein
MVSTLQKDLEEERKCVKDLVKIMAALSDRMCSEPEY